MNKIDLLIPTYNRSKDLSKNLHFLASEIKNLSKNRKVRIIISDNFSSDNTQEMVQSFKSSHSELEVLYHRNSDNIGLEKNMVQVLSLAETDYILWCGDDDAIEENYLGVCFDTIEQKPHIGLQITGILKINEKGEQIPVREEDFEHKEFKAGKDVVLKYSYLGHQLSGLLMKRENLLEDYLGIGENRNLYLFVYFVTNRMLQWDVLYIPSIRTKVPVFNEKDWSYNKLGLLDEIKKAYLPFKKQLGTTNLMRLMLTFIKLQGDFRLRIKLNRPFRLMKQYFQLIHLMGYNLYFAVNLWIVLTKIYLSLLFRK